MDTSMKRKESNQSVPSTKNNRSSQESPKRRRPNENSKESRSSTEPTKQSLQTSSTSIHSKKTTDQTCNDSTNALGLFNERLSKGICVDLALNQNLKCKKGICQPVQSSNTRASSLIPTDKSLPDKRTRQRDHILLLSCVDKLVTAMEEADQRKKSRQSEEDRWCSTQLDDKSVTLTENDSKTPDPRRYTPDSVSLDRKKEIKDVLIDNDKLDKTGVEGKQQYLKGSTSAPYKNRAASAKKLECLCCKCVVCKCNQLSTSICSSEKENATAKPHIEDAKPEIKDAKPKIEDAKPEIKDAKSEIEDAKPEIEDARPEIEETVSQKKNKKAFSQKDTDPNKDEDIIKTTSLFSFDTFSRTGSLNLDEQQNDIAEVKPKELYSLKTGMLPQNSFSDSIQYYTGQPSQSVPEIQHLSAGKIHHTLTTTQKLGLDLQKKPSCSCLPSNCTCTETGRHWIFKRDRPDAKKRTVDLTESVTGSRTSEDLTDECICSHSTPSFDSLVLPTEISGSELEPEIEYSVLMYESDSICNVKTTYSSTIVVVRPDAMIFKDVIKRVLIYVGGLDIIAERTLMVTAEQASEIFSNWYGTIQFPLLVTHWSSGELLVMSVAGRDAVQAVKNLVGDEKLIPTSWLLPASLKRRFMSCFKEEIIEGVKHVSENNHDAAVEHRYFFPQTIVEPIMKNKVKVTDYYKKYLDSTLSEGLELVANVKPLDPIIFLAEWLLLNNPHQPYFHPKNINLLPT